MQGNPLELKDELLHITLMDGQARVLFCRTTNAAREMARIHQPSSTACAALARLMTATVMLGVTMKGDNASVTTVVEGGGPIGRMTAVANGANMKVSAYNASADVPAKPDGHLDVGTLVGMEGKLTVIKDLGFGEPYIGQVNLVSGEMGEDFAQYYTASEQTPSLVALGALVHQGEPVSAGGILVQAMPGCEEKTLSELELRSMFFMNISREVADMELEELATRWFDGLNMRILSRESLSYRCDCSREKMERALLALGERELRDIIDTDGQATLACHFCRTEQVFTKEQLNTLLEKALKKA